MKYTRHKTPKVAFAELRPEYDVAYDKTRPNRFAVNAPTIKRAIVLEPDVAEAFPTSRQVNRALRSLLPKQEPQSSKSGKRLKPGSISR